MAKDSSFDIVSQVDLFEIDNALNMSNKEIATRFDFKGSISKLSRSNNTLDIIADDETKLKNVQDIFESKLAKRNINIGFIKYHDPEDALGGNVKQKADILNGIDKEKAKEITKFIKQTKIKVNTQIQDNQIRVTSPKKDFLQDIMQKLKTENLGIVLQFTNYR